MITHNGTFTIEAPDRPNVGKVAAHKTFKINTVKKGGLKGDRILSILNGPDNTRDYVGFAFVKEDRIEIWRRFSSDPQWKVYGEMLIDLMKGDKSVLAKRGYVLHAATVCRICNRKLTTPQSVKDGIGPECSGRNRRKESEGVAEAEFETDPLYHDD